MKAIIDDLNKLGKEIETAKTSVSQLEGRRTEVLNRMKEEFNVTTVEAAETMLDTMVNELTEQETSIQADFKALKEKFSW